MKFIRNKNRKWECCEHCTRGNAGIIMLLDQECGSRERRKMETIKSFHPEHGINLPGRTAEGEK
jgi:hypothetical protein